MKLNGSIKTESSAEDEPSATEPVHNIFPRGYAQSVVKDSENKLAPTETDFLHEATEIFNSADSLLSLDTSGSMLAASDENCSHQPTSRGLISAAADNARHEYIGVFTAQKWPAPAQLSRLVNAGVCSEQSVVNNGDSRSFTSKEMKRDSALHFNVLPQTKCGRRRVGVYGTCKTNIRTEMFK